MKKKTHKIFGVGLVVMLVVSLLAFATPVAAEEYAPKANVWTNYESPVQGAQGGWFYDPAITRVGPIAKDKDGATIYAYVENAPVNPLTANPNGPYDIFISHDGGRSWTTSTAPNRYSGGRVVDMVCSSLYAETLYVTDGYYVYVSEDGGMNFTIVAKENLELFLMGACGITVTGDAYGGPITCIDVGYNAGDEPILFIGTRNVGNRYPAGHALEFQAIVGTVLWINTETYPAEWYDLSLTCYGCCDIGVTAAVLSENIGTADGTLTNFYAYLTGSPVVPGTVTVSDSHTTIGATVDTGDGTTTNFTGTLANTPLLANSVYFYYYSPVTGEIIGTGDGTNTVFSTTLANAPLWVPYGVTVYDAGTTETLTDDGYGNLSSGAGGTGTINYATGDITVNFAIAPAAAENVLVDYEYYDAVVDDGLGNLASYVGTTSFGTIDYDTGAYDVTFDLAPGSGVSILTQYTYYGVSETFTDNGAGVLTGDNGGSGTIAYDTGYIDVTFGTAPASGDVVMVSYSYYSGGGEGCFDVYAVGAPPNFADTNKAYALVTTDDLNCDGTADDPSTQVISTEGTTCSWDFVSELCYNCDETNPFEIIHASRFAFPGDFADTSTMFIGVTAWNGTTTHTPGGDVYMVMDTTPDSDPAIDLNVQGFTTGCIGYYHANICSLDIKGNTDDASLIAGAYDDYEFQNGTTVFYSVDGGWTWSASKKDPTGVMYTYVLWYGNSAVAGTYGCDCAFSMSCGEEVGEYWNQISLISMCIDNVRDLSHAPGYVDGASTMYVLTYCGGIGDCGENSSLLRLEGTVWERVFSSFTYATDGDDAVMEWVEVDPYFNTTGCLYLASTDFQMYRSTDTGCSWAALSYPCEPRPDITAWIVVDDETVLASSCEGITMIWKTDRHGTRPWDYFPIMDAYCGVDFDLSPNIGTDMQVLFGDDYGQVFISENLGSTWDQVFNPASIPCNVLDAENTYVQFDPGYGTSGDPGENMIYAAAGSIIARCDIDTEAPWAAQCWETISDDVCQASGIDAEGDTALYVSDAGTGGDFAPGGVLVNGQVSAEWSGEYWLDSWEEIWYEYGYLGYGYSEDIQLPLVGVIDIMDKEVTSVTGEFEDDELVVHVSDVLTTTGFNRYWALGFEGIDAYDYCDYEWIDYGDGVTTDFTFTTYWAPIDAFSVYVYDDSTDETLHDNYGDGTLWSDVTYLQAGTVNYATGELSFSFSIPPEVDEDIWVDYCGPEEVYFYSTGNGVSGKVFVPPDVVVEVGIYDYDTSTWSPSATAGTYDPVTGYFSLEPATLTTEPYLRFYAIGYMGYAYIFVPITYPITSFYGSFWGDIYPYDPFEDIAFPFPAVTGTIGLQAPYSGATGEITLINETVWLPPAVWHMVLEMWDFGGYDWLNVFLEMWLTGVVREVVSTNLITDVYGATGEADCPAGVWRTLNPLDFIPPGVPFDAVIEFEKLTKGLNTDSYLVHDGYLTSHSDDLWLTNKGMSNILWCLDGAYPTYVWVWDDPLANPVTLESPACGAQLPSPGGVTLEWTALDGATEYEIELYQYCPQCPDEKLEVDVPNSKDTCVIVDGLAPGTEHYWRVRVALGEPYLSKWSELCTFTTALGSIPNLCSPPCGAEDVILNTNFSWDEVPGAAGYELQIVAAGADGTADFTGAETRTTNVNALASIPGLEYSTTYYWRVRAVTAGVPGAWSVCLFTTIGQPEEPVPCPDLVVEIPAEEVVTPTWIWVLIGIGAALTIAVVILIVTTRRVP